MRKNNKDNLSLIIVILIIIISLSILIYSIYSANNNLKSNIYDNNNTTNKVQIYDITSTLTDDLLDSL